MSSRQADTSRLIQEPRPRALPPSTRNFTPVGLPTKTTYDDALTVIQALLDSGYEAMFAGGCVRDRLLGTPPKDFDVATTAHPAEATSVFKKLRYRVIPTGIDHGTVSIITASGPVEVTTLRHDIKTDGRHAIVDFENATFRTDAARRDFTINAMFEDKTGTIHDFFNGKADLKAQILRFVGEPGQRIREDYLRILRFFRFWSRLGFTPAPDSLKYVTSEASGLRQISQERITSELWGIFSAPNAKNALVGMEQCGVTAVVLPEAIAIDDRLQSILHTVPTVNEPVRPWLTLSLMLGILHEKTWDEESLRLLGRRLRLSEKDGQTLLSVFEGFGFLSTVSPSTIEVATVLDFAEKLEVRGPEFALANFFGPIWLFLAKNNSDVRRVENIEHVLATDNAFLVRRKCTMPITGRDLLELHPSLVGSAIGNAMLAARRAFRNGRWTTHDEGLIFLKQLF